MGHRPGMRIARPGPGKGWRPTRLSGRPSSRPKLAHLVLEQLAQRLDQLHVHALGQAADVVVRLDGDRRPAGEGHRLDDVGIERALGQEVGAAELARLLVEDVDEGGADDLALLLRVGRRRPACRGTARSHRGAPGGCCSGRGTARPPPPPRRRAAGRGRRRCRSAARPAPRGSAPPRPRSRRRPTARRSPDRRRPPGRGYLLDRLVAEGGHGPVAGAARHPVGEVGQQPWRRRACAPPRGGTARRRCSLVVGHGGEGRAVAADTTRKPSGSRTTRSPWLIQT